MIDRARLERALMASAREGRAVTYGQLLTYLGYKIRPAFVAALCRALGEVGARIEALGGPDLAVLVVRKADGLPGEGWFASHRARKGWAGPSTGPQAVARVAALQAAAQAWALGIEDSGRKRRTRAPAQPPTADRPG